MPDNTGIQMKYFLLKPKGDTAYARASRAAMNAYATSIHDTNSVLSTELRQWVEAEIANKIVDNDTLANSDNVEGP